MDNLTLEPEQLQQTLITDQHDQQNSLITRIDEWKLRSIERIKQIANQARQEVRDIQTIKEEDSSITI